MSDEMRDRGRDRRDIKGGSKGGILKGGVSRGAIGEY